MSRHPRDEELLGYCEGSLDPRARESIESHVAEGCSTCRTRIEGYREVLDLLAARPLEAVSDHEHTSAMAALRAAGAIREKPRRRAPARIAAVREAIQAIQMSLRLDSGAAAVIPGVRSPAAASMQPRRLFFEAPRGSLHLQIEHLARGRIDLSGQFLPAEGDFGGEAGQIVLQRGRRMQRAPLADTGEFRFPSIPAEAIRLRIEWREAALLVGPLDLRSGAEPSGDSDFERSPDSLA